MPILADPSDWIDPDEVPRPIVTFGAAMAGVGRIELDLHRHKKGQVLFVQRGALSCEVEGGLWIVPPRSAVWIPGGALHAITATGGLEGFAAFVDPAVSRSLPETCCAVSVTPLLRELLIRSAHLPALYDEGGANSRLVAVLLDEIAAAQIEDLHLPMPIDARLRGIVDLMMASPSDRGTLEVWAKRAGLSERTLARMISRETGMSFGRWRQQLGVMLAVKWLAGGASIQQAAADLGYESVPSFVTMFRKALGTSPGRYMAERRPGSSANRLDSPTEAVRK
ncbi:AraC family transcriptional regulator [Reyranella sp.]|uniref:AraC family transcriptional regulator n=1 Tax=Reyranella sp. TaxID=1929291 RepID=UPI003D144B59